MNMTTKPWRRTIWAGVLGAAASLGPAALAVDWPHYRGPNFDGVSLEKGWNGKAVTPENVAWRKNVGTGASSVVVVGGRLYTMGNRANQDVVQALDAKTGEEIWSYRYDCKLDARQFDGGPGATPVVDGQLVYTVSHEGHLHALNKADGKVAWSLHLVNDLGGVRPKWGFAGSPLVVEGLLILEVGGDRGSTVALDKLTGKVKWAVGAGKIGYSCIVPFTTGGTRALAVFRGDRLVAQQLDNGRELWDFPWPTNYGVNAATPIAIDGHLFISSGYNTGAAMLRVATGKPEKVWQIKEMANQTASSVFIDGHLYGFSGNLGGKGVLTCLNASTGAVLWQHKGLGTGALSAADGQLIIASENGELVIAKASPAGYAEIARAQIVGRPSWVAPVLADGRIYIKDNKGTLACLDVSR